MDHPWNGLTAVLGVAGPQGGGLRLFWTPQALRLWSIDILQNSDQLPSDLRFPVFFPSLFAQLVFKDEQRVWIFGPTSAALVGSVVDNDGKRRTVCQGKLISWIIGVWQGVACHAQPRTATPETALWPFQGWAAHRWHSAVFYPFGHPTPYAHVGNM
jgi:hypothetical protein